MLYPEATLVSAIPPLNQVIPDWDVISSGQDALRKVSLWAEAEGILWINPISFQRLETKELVNDMSHLRLFFRFPPGFGPVKPGLSYWCNSRTENYGGLGLGTSRGPGQSLMIQVSLGDKEWQSEDGLGKTNLKAGDLVHLDYINLTTGNRDRFEFGFENPNTWLKLPADMLPGRIYEAHFDLDKAISFEKTYQENLWASKFLKVSIPEHLQKQDGFSWEAVYWLEGIPQEIRLSTGGFSIPRGAIGNPLTIWYQPSQKYNGRLPWAVIRKLPDHDLSLPKDADFTGNGQELVKCRLVIPPRCLAKNSAAAVLLIDGKVAPLDMPWLAFGAAVLAYRAGNEHPVADVEVWPGLYGVVVRPEGGSFDQFWYAKIRVPKGASGEDIRVEKIDYIKR